MGRYFEMLFKVPLWIWIIIAVLGYMMVYVPAVLCSTGLRNTAANVVIMGVGAIMILFGVSSTIFRLWNP